MLIGRRFVAPLLLSLLATGLSAPTALANNPSTSNNVILIGGFVPAGRVAKIYWSGKTAYAKYDTGIPGSTYFEAAAKCQGTSGSRWYYSYCASYSGGPWVSFTCSLAGYSTTLIDNWAENDGT